VHGLEAEYWGRIDFVYLNREAPANASLVQQYGIRYQPVIILIGPDGTEVQRWPYLDEDKLRAALDEYLASTGG
jgi:thioredoxin-like negative regulator of GroEL